jgi:hypothetical protein
MSCSSVSLCLGALSLSLSLSLFLSLLPSILHSLLSSQGDREGGAEVGGGEALNASTPSSLPPTSCPNASMLTITPLLSIPRFQSAPVATVVLFRGMSDEVTVGLDVCWWGQQQLTPGQEMTCS